jgi:hypothetical protein
VPNKTSRITVPSAVCAEFIRQQRACFEQAPRHAASLSVFNLHVRQTSEQRRALLSLRRVPAAVASTARPAFA